MEEKRNALLTAIRVFHTAVWLLVEAALGYLISTGFTNHRSRLVAVSGAVVAVETVVYLANGASCPLTDLAESLGTDSGSVTDIYLPRWLAKSLPFLHVPLVLLALFLHRPRRQENRQLM